MKEEYSTEYKILMTLRRIAESLDQINDILAASKDNDDEEEDDDDDKLVIGFRVRKYSWDARGQVAATYTLSDAIKLCPVGYCVFDDNDEIMYRNTGAGITV